MARQSEHAKNVDPVITSAEISKRRDDVQFTSAGIMNRPKPKPKAPATNNTTETPAPETKKEESKKDDVDMDGAADGGPQIEEMDVGE